MSLEELLAENNKLLTQHNELLAEVIGAAKGAKPAAAKADNDSGEEAPKTRRGRKPKGDGDETAKTTKGSGKPPSVEDVRTAFSDYLDIEDADEYKRRKIGAKKIIEGFGVAKSAQIPAEHRQEALDQLADLIKDGGAEDGGEDEDEI